jgi:uncharacterized protein (TIGR02757 family)
VGAHSIPIYRTKPAQMDRNLQSFLDYYAHLYNRPSFIPDDPIVVPHRFSLLQDIEITAFWTAMLAWGQRKTIIQKAELLFEMMDNAPYAFIRGHSEKDLLPFLNFKHRTFQGDDTLYFISFFRQYFDRFESLEAAFAQFLSPTSPHVGPALSGFHQLFFPEGYTALRTRKHVATPDRGSTCKRLNMFLRWMVRSDQYGVDFGLWKQIRPNQLLMPLDVHVERVARRLGLIQRKATDWQTVLELTENLRAFDAADPVRYDFALFGIGKSGE